MKTVKIWLLILVVSGIFETTASAQQGMDTFAVSTYGCDTPEKTARLSWLEERNKPQFSQELQERIASGQCRVFNRGDRYDQCSVPNRMIEGRAVNKVLAMSDGREYWILPGKVTGSPRAFGGRYALRRASFGCTFHGDTEHLVWLQKANQSQFDAELEQFVSSGKCRRFTNESLGSVHDLYSIQEHVLRGTALVQYGDWWVPSKDITKVSD